MPRRFSTSTATSKTPASPGVFVSSSRVSFPLGLGREALETRRRLRAEWLHDFKHGRTRWVACSVLLSRWCLIANRDIRAYSEREPTDISPARPRIRGESHDTSFRAAAACRRAVCGVGDGFRIAGVGKRITDPEDRHGCSADGGVRPSSGALGEDEFAFDDEDSPAAYDGTISMSSGSGGGPNVTGASKAKSNPTVNTSFEGLNFYQQRYSRGGTSSRSSRPTRPSASAMASSSRPSTTCSTSTTQPGSRSCRTTRRRTSSAGFRAT